MINRKKSGMEIFEMILCCLMIALQIGEVIYFFAKVVPSGEALPEMSTLSITVCAGLTVLAFVSCLIYIHKGQTKSAAFFYKSFLLILGLSQIVELIICAVKLNKPVDAASHGLLALLLIFLVFIKDFGEENTWFVFTLLFAIFTVLVFIAVGTGSVFSKPYEMIGIRAVNLFSQPVIVAIIGFVIKAKYNDKSARHSDNS